MKTALGILGSVFLAAFSLILAGCGMSVLEENRYQAFDAVKGLRADRANDSHLYQQSSYPIDSRARLLLRYEDLLKLNDEIVINSNHAARVELSVLNIDQKAEAAERLRVCPMNRNWMMLATWYQAHPFGGGEDWSEPGGDYVRRDCIKADILSESSPTLSFNASNWLSQYVFARSANYGLVVINDDSQTIDIIGDGAGYLGPRLIYDKLSTVVTTDPDWTGK